MKKPLCIDLFCGLGGWAHGFLAEGYDVIGFDIERHQYGDDKYPGQLVLQDVLTLDGRQFRNAAVIVASPPCQEYSYMAMPWKRAKQIARALRGEDSFPDPYNGSRTIEDLTRLFCACFRIAREAGVPLIVENVKGAQPWVGSAAWNFGSFYLWGDILALMPLSSGTKLPAHINESIRKGKSPARWTNPAEHYFGRKVPGIKLNEKGFNVAAAQRLREENGLKNGGDWFGSGKDCSFQRRQSGQNVARKDRPGYPYSPGDSRKAASAQIAKIPFPLAQHIARVFHPDGHF